MKPACSRALEHGAGVVVVVRTGRNEAIDQCEVEILPKGLALVQAL